MNLADISQGLADRLSTVDNVRPYAGLVDDVFTGNGIAVLVYPADEWVDYLQAMRGGLAVTSWLIEPVVQRANLRASYARMCELVSAGAGESRSLSEAINPDSLPQTLGGVCNDVVVRSASGFVEKVFGQVTYVGVELTVDVHVSRVHS